MKLQKLVFFAYCQHLIKFKKPFFKNDWEAWEYGPCSPKLYLKTLEYTKKIPKDLKIIENFNISCFKPQQIQIMDNILKKYGSYTANRLVMLTHEVDSPWTRSFLFKDWSLNPITDKRILKFYEEKGEHFQWK
ncbi:hypothetical protein CWO85_01750 [Candidatus Phytoplasma ziziphi]|uniref:Antitoxin SocA-like Panacea domain-containing protein n=1 Tax=Ziziphus jujuba witches'-broom phytoplasma TaxID=135727 RepID=A0A660HMI4_ZIZJU|nr:type II toxin-antitoxin system antitoxin SocA domain-containing protein [Candidatus Phytoplasma ziziphi]AYJ01247.1 hypothetical protein CWO85_01750 [Candidatus Phytoplasma ziziphi]